MYTESDWYMALETLTEGNWTPKKLAALAMEWELHRSNDLDRVAKWVRDCLSPRRGDQLFKQYALIRIMEQTGNHGPFLFIADVLGYEVRLKPKEAKTGSERRRIVDRRQSTFWRKDIPAQAASILAAGRFNK